MSIPHNPFKRGCYSFGIQRVAVVRYADNCPQTCLPLHPSQDHLPEEKIIQRACMFNNDFVFVTEDQITPPEIDTCCTGTGAILNVLYSMIGSNGETFFHMGDIDSLSAAKNVEDLLMFETGLYNRCWEISDAHLPAIALGYLTELTNTSQSSGLLFEAFRIPSSPALGVKLISIPWNDFNMRDDAENFTSNKLRQEHLKIGVPEALVNVLHLAAQADVRILIFDANASIIEGLPLYDHDYCS